MFIFQLVLNIVGKRNLKLVALSLSMNIFQLDLKIFTEVFVEAEYG